MGRKRVEKKYQGVVIPMVTPFTDDGTIDEQAAVKLSKLFAEEGVFPFLLGTTGEAASISAELKLSFVKAVVQAVGDQTVLYAGIPGTSLSEITDTAARYYDIGVGVFVVHLPYYYPLTEHQMLNYFETLAERIPGPMMLYNIPPTTHMSIPLNIIETLSHHPNIIGIKDSERNLERLRTSIARWSDREDFSFLIGWGNQMAEGLLLGADGIVPSVGNIVPRLCFELFTAARAGDIEKARAVQEAINQQAALYQENRTLGESLAGLKVLLHLKGLCEPYVLPPLTRLAEEEETAVRKKAAEIEGHVS